MSERRGTVVGLTYELVTMREFNSEGKMTDIIIIPQKLYNLFEAEIKKATKNTKDVKYEIDFCVFKDILTGELERFKLTHGPFYSKIADALKLDMNELMDLMDLSRTLIAFRKIYSEEGLEKVHNSGQIFGVGKIHNINDTGRRLENFKIELWMSELDALIKKVEEERSGES